jgi:hypothetical protein
MRTENITDEQLTALCSEIAELTDNNQHTEANKIVCGFLDYDDLHALLCEVDSLHIKAGHLSFELGAIRSKIHNLMMQNIKADYCTKIYDAIKKSY